MLELLITSLSHAGEGLARHEGRVVFVPFALPGERVRVELIEEKKTFARARLLEVLTPSPDRVAPRCPHHFSISNPQSLTSTCGGCQLQHLAYSAQLHFKQEQVIEQLTRIGGWPEAQARALVRPTFPSPQPFGYRNQMQFALTPDGRPGLHAASSNAIVPIRECHIAAPVLMELFARLAIEPATEIEQVTLRAGADDALVIFEAAVGAPELEIDLPVSVALLRPDGASLALAGRDYLVETVKGRDFRISAGSFFQVNTALTERLVDEVLNALELRGGETVLDVYSGVGLFSAFIAPLAARVIGIESFEPAVDDAAVNLNEFENVEIYNAPAEDVLPTLTARVDAAVLDPPRAGCAPAVLDALLALVPKRVVYVSCDPATLARDAKRLSAGGYRLDFVRPLDMFPQTHHVESVARFSHV
ncbi:MAG: 23S rRNA (uracil(1939)-C(5))-methyltransferase RlmD [Anaerolineales bacterium]|nr:23S rRNA (uracil(1939)-C(5))-methyltransferase RlmD [Anaerolineales bacterium]